jgi:mono/diheme cytochrome c family protein
MTALTRCLLGPGRRAGIRGLTVLLIASAAGCDNGDPTPDWSRMITQPKLLPFGTTDLFADQRAMRPLPIGTVARETLGDRAPRAAPTTPAISDAADVPVPVTRALLERGRARFAIACATCHGVAGDGDTVVARNMQRRRPPSLHEPRIVALSPGALYRVIVAGYGLMPSYAKLVEPADRWAVVAYVRTLALSWGAKLAALPAEVRGDAARRLR